MKEERDSGADADAAAAPSPDKASSGRANPGEDRHLAALRAAVSIIWTTDASGAFVERQPMWEAFTGQLWPDHQGYGWGAMLHPKDRGRITSEWSEAVASASPYSTSGRVWHAASSSYHHFIVRAVPIFAADGSLAEWIGTITDVQADRDALEQSEQEARSVALEFQTLADNIPTLCWMAHGDGHIYWYNKRWYEYTGTSPEDQKGWGWESVHDPAVLPAVLKRWKHSLATGTEFEMTFPLRGADGVFRPFLTRIVPIRDEGGTIVRWFGTNTDVSEIHASEGRLAAQIAELKALYDSAPIGLAFFSRDYRYLRINEELAAINGVPAQDHIGRTIREVLSDSAPPVEPVIDQVFATGESLRFETSGETPRHPGVLRHWLAGFYPVKDEQGSVATVGAWVVEITERKAAEQREILLAREVDHRAKNLLAVVQSVVQLTRAETAAELKEAVVGRIQSLASAHALLAESRWEGVELSQLVAEELAPFSGAQARFEGPAVNLRPAAAQSIALVLHELATNAAKYGALCTDAGRLDLKWRVDGDPPLLIIEWAESANPGTSEPTTQGFGSRIIRTSIEQQLRGRVIQDWRPDGLHCRLEIPLANVVVGDA